MTTSATELPPRLAAIARLVPAAARVADIGSDHGLLPVFLLRSGGIDFALATERTEARAARLVAASRAGASGRSVVVRAGDGFEAVRPGDAIDTVVLAGLGGRAIARILASEGARRASPRTLLLQPRSESSRLRAFLSEAGWRLDAETLTAERGRLHLTLRAVRGDDAALYRHETLSRQDLLAAGPILVRARPPEARAHWLRERERLAEVLERGRAGSRGTAAAREALARAERILAALGPDRATAPPAG